MIIYAPGDPDGHLHFLLEGTVRLYKIYGEYKEATVALLAEGNVFGSARLATLLPHLGHRPYGSGTVLKVRLTHQDLADMIFSTREAVSKEMSGFQRAGLIEVRNRRISVTPQLAKRRSSETLSNPGTAA